MNEYVYLLHAFFNFVKFLKPSLVIKAQWMSFTNWICKTRPKFFFVAICNGQVAVDGCSLGLIL